jgi:diguanylate cyclase (GGDEF)-like protein/PAS domain S-box-containing protein
MKDEEKTKEQLINELTQMREKIASLEVEETEREPADGVLERNRQEYSSLVDLSPDGIVLLKGSEIIFANSRVRDMLGFDESVYVGKNIIDALSSSLADVMSVMTKNQKQRVMEDLERSMAGDLRAYMHEVPVKNERGQLLWVEINAIPIEYKGEAVLLGFLRNVTQRKLAEEAMRESEEKHRNLVERATDGITIVQDSILMYVNPALARILGYSVEEMTDTSFSDYVPSDELPLVQDRYKRRMAGESIPSIYESVLLHKDGNRLEIEYNVGVIQYGGRPADLIIVRDITDRKRVEGDLHLIRKVIESSNEAIGMSDPQRKHFYQNKAFTDLFGYTAEELAAKGGGPVVYADQEVAREVFDTIMLGRSWSGETEMVSKSGRRFPVFLRADAVKDDAGEIIGLIGIHAEITERKQVQEALRESEAKYRDLVERANDGICIIQDGLVKYVNLRVFDVIGYTPQEVCGTSITDYVYPDEVPNGTDRYNRRLAGDDVPQIYETALQHKDGSRVEVEISVGDIPYDGGIANLIIARDITERKKIEAELKESEAWLKKAQQLAQVGSWKWDLVDGSMRMSEEMYRIYGVEDSQFVSISDVLRTSIYPEDKELVMREMDKITTGLSSDPMVYRIVRPDGTLRWIAATETEVKHADSDGKPKIVVGTVQDITERKQMEETLKYRIEFEKLVTAISASCISLAPEDIDREINRALQSVGEFVGVDRSYVFLFSEDGTTISNTHEWCAKGIESQTGKLQEMPASEPKWLIGKVNQRENIYIPCVADLPPEASVEKEAFESHGIQSLVVVPMAYGGSLLGFLGFDSVKAEMPWPEDSVALLKMVGEILANALVSKRVEKALQQRSRELYLLNTMAQSLAKAGTVAEVLRTALNSTLEATQMQLGAIYLIDENAKKMVMVAHNGSDEELINLFGEVLLDTGIVGDATLTGKVITVTDFSGDERVAPGHKEALQGINIQTMINLPLKSQNRVIGVLGACSTEQKDFNEEDIRLLETIGGDVGGAIEKAQLLERTSELSITDEVTGLYNRRHFYDVLERDISRMQRYGNVLSLVMIDLDGFKEYNDRFGHTNGDAVLKEFAQTVQTTLRKSDTAFRFGGDEFVITLPSTKAEKARQVMDRVRLKWLRVTGAEFSASQVPLLFSIGIAQFPDDAETTDGLVFLADAALYQCKRQGGSPCVLACELDAYTPEVPGVAMGEQVYALAAMVDAKDPYTYGHSTRVAAIAVGIGQHIGVSERDLLNLQSASLLHDIGKVGVPDSILGKAEKLTPEEWKVVQRHSAEGAKIVGHIGELKALVPMILHHHEWYDGSGYPTGLVRKKIPLGARIISIADAYETMRTRRPYRTKVSHDVAIKELRKAAGSQFDPQLVEALCQAMSDTDDDDNDMSDNP